MISESRGGANTVQQEQRRALTLLPAGVARVLVPHALPLWVQRDLLHHRDRVIPGLQYSSSVKYELRTRRALPCPVGGARLEARKLMLCVM
jgi:hypothetical protein